MIEAVAIFERIFDRRPSAEERAELETWPEIDAATLAHCFALQVAAGRKYVWSVAAALQRRGLLPWPESAEAGR